MHRKFLRDSLICFIPCLIAAIIVFRAYQKFEAGTGGFKLGVDLVGGTILIYEVDQERERQRQSLESGGKYTFAGAKTSQALAEAIKRRIDPSDVQNITVRPAGDNRIEVILPTGTHRANAEGKKELNTGDVAKIRSLIEQVGSLEFRIVANSVDDARAFSDAEKLFEDASPDDLRSRAESGVLPPAPVAPENDPYIVHGDPATYAWVELDQKERNELGLLNKNETEDPTKQSKLWQLLRDAREKHRVVRYPYGGGTEILLFSRKCLNTSLTQRDEIKYEYFTLTRFSDRVVVDGTHVTISATRGDDPSSGPIVQFAFNSEGARQFGTLTSKNKPEQDGKLVRHLAIILNGKLIQFPSLRAVISDRGQISGQDFTAEYVNEVVKLLRSGALPATLKQKPVAENTVGATLGADTIKSGTRAIGLAYMAVLLFMLVYYRFAGFVACIALLANLLLTIGFMVLVNATFTLPGLAGLVLMLGMAVDANILIYERVREERDRGANLQMAIRNGYDRAFGTIIDTHLSSIFTAIVLYSVGNDQLRGFGISLAVGLVISLFTSLFMTHLIFDFWIKKHWLKNLRMMRFLTKPSIDFMKLRKVMFPITGALTVLGLGLFLLRGESGLNVDFVGGTVYGGQLRNKVDIGVLRDRVSETQQEKRLNVASVERVANDDKAHHDVFVIKYTDGESRRIELALGLKEGSEEEKLDELKKRASHLPDASVEQNFLSDAKSDESEFFTIRTIEKEPELVQAAIDRLFRGDNGESMLAQTKLQTARHPEGDRFYWNLDFVDADGNPKYASEAYIRTLLEREFRAAMPEGVAILEPFRLQGVGEAVDGRFHEMKLTLSSEAWERVRNSINVDDVLEKVKKEYNQRPQPERLENFDATLAGEMRNRAFAAIIASWAALLMYLWFRFGNWTFGLAAVLCLIHDLCFTIGAIGVSHYLYDTAIGKLLGLQDFKIDFTTVAALLTLVGYSVNEIIVNFARLREVRGKNPLLTPQMINDSVNQTLSRTILTSTTVWLVVMVLYAIGGSGVHLFAFVMVVGVLVGTYSSIYVACPLLLIFGEGVPEKRLASSQQSREAAAAALRGQEMRAATDFKRTTER